MCSSDLAEKHDAELKQKAAVYINSDGTGKGWLNAGGSHGLQQFMNEAAKDVMDPRSGRPIFEEARKRAVGGEPEADRKAAEADPSLRLSPLGSGSDFTPFLQHLTLSALSIGFGGESPGGVYHSAYDTVKWYQTFSDGDYSYGRTLSQLAGTLLMRLADAPVLPFQFSDTADTLLRYVVELEKLAADELSSATLRAGQLEGFRLKLTAKVGGLIAYIVLGTLAMKPQRPRRLRILCWFAAQGVFFYIVSVGLTHNALPWAR